MDGSGRHTFPEIFLEHEEPVGLAVFENSFIWANKIQLFHTSPHTPKERVVLLNASISALSVLHKSQQPKSKSKFEMLKNQNAYYTASRNYLIYYCGLVLELAILRQGKCSGYDSRLIQDFSVR